MNHRVRLRIVDVVDDDRVIGGLGRNALIVDDLDRRAGILDEFAEGIGLRSREFVGRVENGDFLAPEARAIVRNKVRNGLRPDGGDRVGPQREESSYYGNKASAGSGLVEQETL